MPRIAILGLVAIGLLASARAPLAAGPRQGPARGRGVPQRPSEPPDEGALVLPTVIAGATEARLLHEDELGQADRQLLAVAGRAPAGFAALWSDQRHGPPSVYLRCFDSAGTPRGDERPVRERASLVLEEGASLALGPGGQGAVAWSLAGGAPRPGVFQVRAFGPSGAFEGLAELVGSSPVSETRGEREPSELLPSAFADADGTISVAWIYAGRPRVLELGQSVRLLDPRPIPERPDEPEQPAPAEGLEDPLLPEAVGPEAAGLVRWVAQRGGAPLAIWNAGDEILAAALTPDSRPESSGQGSLIAAVPDPREDGGAWLLILRDARVLLRPLDARARPAGDDLQVLESLPAHLDLASWSEGLVLLIQERARSAEGPGGPFKLRFLAADGTTRARAPIAVAAKGIEPRIAGAGESLLVAWSERRESGLEVQGRLLRAGEAELGPEWPLAEARATSHQSQPAASSVVDQRAVVVWLDERGGHALPYARLVSRAGDPMGAELRVPTDAAGAPIDPGPTSDAAVSMGPAGDFLVSWLEPAGLACQVFEPEARPKRPPEIVAAAPERELGYAVVRQESHRSWLLAWREAAGLVVRRVRGDGVPLAQPTAVVGTEHAAEPALLELDDERVVVAWEEIGEGLPRLELRLLHADLHASTEVIQVPLPPRASHRGPRLAPGPGGGFLLAWTAELSPTETVIAARQFDADAQPVGAPWALSDPAGREEGLSLAALGDGSWLFAFAAGGTEGGRIAVRRLWPGKTAPEPLRLLDPPVSGYVQGSRQPVVIGLEDGWIGLWVDAHRGQGLDVWFRRAGLDFD